MLQLVIQGEEKFHAKCCDRRSDRIGRALIARVLEERAFLVESIKFLASSRSEGKSIRFRGTSHSVESLRPEAFAGIDYVLSSTPASISREFSPIAAKAGAIVIDNSSAWRMDPEVPLVVPEVNSSALDRIPKGIIANPNCSTIQLVVALKPLHDLATIKQSSSQPTRRRLVKARRDWLTSMPSCRPRPRRERPTAERRTQVNSPAMC